MMDTNLELWGLVEYTEGEGYRINGFPSGKDWGEK